MRRRAIIFLVILGLISPVVLALYNDKQSAGAVSGNDFKAGRIIDDPVFYDGDSLSASEVQAFLNAKVPSCDTNGDKTIFDSTHGDTVTRKVYAERRGVSTPFICLKSYKQDTPSRPAESGLCNSLSSRTNRTAAQIINDVARACNVSQKALIVLLQKEQSLITDDWPWPYQYDRATGYGCPDTAPCNEEYFGFFNQVYKAARQFKVYRYWPDSFNYIAGRDNTILWHPNSSCGTSTVYIQNQATAGLYNYTPYRPNQAALNNLYGLGDSCSSYGNRNFWRLFHDWFGSTYMTYQKLKIPRWMQLADDVTKKNIFTGEVTGGTHAEGTHLWFADKIKIDGKSYLRTQSDHKNNINRGFLFEDLEEIPYEPMDSPRWLNLSTKERKVVPRTEKGIDGTLSKDRRIHFSSKIKIKGKAYIRTTHDTQRGINKAIPYSSLEEVPFKSFKDPRRMRLKNDSQKINPSTEEVDSTVIPSGTELSFDTKITINGSQYYRTKNDSDSGTRLAFPAKDVEDIPYTTFNGGYYCMQIATTSNKVRPRSGKELTARIFEPGRQICLSEQITVDGTTYYRTAHDTQRGSDKGIPASDFEEIPYQSFKKPRMMKLTLSTPAKNPKTGKDVGGTVSKGQTFFFNSKIYADGQWYYRYDTDTAANNDKGFKAEILAND